ncbi:NACHT domain-containing protein [Nocardia alni]|uniref:NACHT domain-containing protein n=1 Tax=Nocardia alni TaxID=2815723 RepID=UPI001C24AD85|nr:hypothetical protein [Nocardia alni]
MFAWAAAPMVAEESTLIPLVAGTVVGVGAQTGLAVDDVAVVTDAGDYALFQAKVGLKLGTTEDGPLAKALAQAVTQYLADAVPQRAGGSRPIDSHRDKLVLCTDTSAPATVREDLASVISRIGSATPGTPFDHNLTGPEEKALNVVLAHVRRLWTTGGRGVPDEEDLRGFFRALHILVLDIEPGRRDHQAAVTALARGLPNAADAALAYDVLVGEGLAAATAQEWRHRPEVGLALSRAAIALSPPVRFAADIATLRQQSATNLKLLQADAQLPVPGGLYISRAAATDLIADAGHENLLIVGDAGAGKSSVAQQFAADREKVGELVVLRATDIAGMNPLPLSAPLEHILDAWVGLPGVVLIDGVDALRGSTNRDFLSKTIDALKGSRWQIIATVRTFDARNNRQLQRTFRGTPISSRLEARDDRLAAVRHLLVGDLTETELDEAIRPPMALATLLAEANPELRRLLRNPFNLRLAAELADGLPQTQHAQLVSVHSRIGLLEEFWSWRIRDEDTTARETLLARLCRAMTDQRGLEVAQEEPHVLSTESPVLDDLLSRGVLRNEGGILPGIRPVLSFTHNILFDYATAIYVLLSPTDQDGLVHTLDTDPTLPLIARPSFEILVDLLWNRRDAGIFWPVCRAVAASPHLLASLAFASRIVNLVRRPDDLLPLAPTRGDTDVSTAMTPTQRLVSQLIGAFRSAAVLPDESAAIVPLASLARRLAENSPSSDIDGFLAIALVDVLQGRAPAVALGPSLDDRCRAVAVLLDRCRTEPERMESLAGATARQLQHLVAISEEVRRAVARLLDDSEALAQWGGTVVTWLAECVAPTASQDPALTRRMASIVMTLKETRDEQVPLGGGGILSLNESRRQQADHGAFMLAEKFGDVCAADLPLAAEIFCDFTDNEDGSQEQTTWPITVAGASGFLVHGLDLSLTRLDSGTTAAAALSNALAQSQPQQTEPAIRVLVGRLHNSSAWAAVLTSHGDPTALGRTVLPALETGSLLTHPDTHPAAARLLAALVNDDSIPPDSLEAAVAEAVALAERNGIHHQVGDVLIGILTPDRIIDPVLGARRSALGDAPPDIPQPVTIVGRTTPWTIIDSVLDSGATLAPTVETAARTLHTELNLARPDGNPSTVTRPEMTEAFLRTDQAFVEAESVPDQLQQLLIDAATVLARADEITPGTPVGDRVVAILVTATASPNAGSF